MSRVRAGIEVPGPVSEAEALWYDHKRWASFVDGFGHLHRIDDSWPAAGSKVVWDSPPGGRGRVREEVGSYEPRIGQTLTVEDGQLRGTQRTTFEPTADGCRIALELEYAIKNRNPFTPLVDVVFVRRALTDSLRRTLRRFATELAAERELATLE